MVEFSYLWCGVMVNLVLMQFCDGGYQKTFSSCNDFKLNNGRMRIKPKGRLAKFQCNRGYMLAGEKYSYCIKGKFDVPPPVCVKPTCPKIKQLTNGLILPSYNGGVVNFYCKPGFTMRGSNISYCDGSRWSHNLPACISTHAQIPTSCDFETEDLCGWSHDLNHDFDWRRQNFQTPSGHIGTGPKHDHTKGNHQDGYYIYTESTSRLEHDVARLLSPLYPAYPRGLCFSFWFHMFGRDMGQLRVYLRRERESVGGASALRPLWVRQGNHGDVWKRGVVEVEEGVDEDFQIIIEGVRGKSYVSDIAVDDVVLTESCPDEEIASSTTDFSTIDDTDQYFGSCTDRCNITSTDLCDCDESCYERNTCCPDYTIVCLIAPFEASSSDYYLELETTTPEMDEIEKQPTTEESSIKIIEFVTTASLTKIKQNVTTPTPSTKTMEIKTETPTKSTIKEIQLTTREIKIQSAVTEPVTTTEVSNSTTLQPNIATTINNTVTIKPINNSTVIPKTEQISITTLSTKPPYSTSVTTRPTTTNRPKINTTKPTKSAPKIDKNKNNINKITTVQPQVTTKTNIVKNNTVVPTVQTMATSTTVKPIPTKSLVITKLPDELDTSVKMQTLEIETDYEPTIPASVEPKMQMVSQKEKIVKEGDSNLTFVIFGTGAVVLIGVIVAVAMFVKYNTKCNRLRFRNSRNSDSMSDVRFLASDEVLDFTWRTSSD